MAAFKLHKNLELNNWSYESTNTLLKFMYKSQRKKHSGQGVYNSWKSTGI